MFGVQAQSGQFSAAADKTVTVASTTANLKASAKTHLLATAGGAYLKLEGGNIELHAPGPVKLKASMENLTGPAMVTTEGGSMPKARELKGCAESLKDAAGSGAPLA